MAGAVCIVKFANTIDGYDNKKGNFTLNINSTGAKTLGYTKHELIGCTVGTLFTYNGSRYAPTMSTYNYSDTE